MPPTSDNLPVKRRDTDAELLRKLKHYLVKVENGVLFNAACRESGLTVTTIRSYRNNHPDFAEAEAIAKAAGTERVEQVLQDKALGGDYNSMSKFLEAHDPKYGPQSKNVSNTVIIIDASNSLEKVQHLREELLRRQRDMPASVVGVNPFMQKDVAPLYDDEIYDAEIL